MSSRNSESDSSIAPQSLSLLTRPRSSGRTISEELPFLYSQCDATPNSATRCISRVRICISRSIPSYAITVVCRLR